jgi:hypothetical protein
MARQLEQQLQSSGLGKMFGNSGMGSIIASMPTAIPMIVLGDQATAMGVGGNSISKRLVKNDVRQLKPNVLEQNMVVQETEQVRGTGEVRRSYTESVMRFTRMNSNQLYTQAALVNYAANGHFLSKVLLYGTVNRGQGSSMPGFPGAFPGMPASGTGGFGDLNNMLKQLQGL